MSVPGPLLPREELTPELMGELEKLMQKPIVKSADMSQELQSECLDIIISGLDKHGPNFEAAARQIKEAVDKKFGSSFHCIIGEAFGFEITHQHKFLLHVFYGTVAVLLFKC